MESQVCVAMQALLWNFTIMTDQNLSHDRNNIVYESSEKHVYLIDVAIAGDGLMAAKFQEKMQKQTD